jgi:hypothetical protein
MKSKLQVGAGWGTCVTIAVTVLMFYLCLLSRTMNPPGDPGEISSGPYFFALASSLLLLVAWRPLIALPLGMALFFCSFIAADIVATDEERRFVESYKDIGKGPTPRWTFRSHWLAYDKETQHLSGGD